MPDRRRRVSDPDVMVPSPQWPVIDWADQTTWHPRLTQWLKPRLKRGYLGRLRKSNTSSFYADDSKWSELLVTELKSEIEVIREGLAGLLTSATIRAYHGCRTEDAGSYFREGLRVHSRTNLIKEFLCLVDEHKDLRSNKERFLQLIDEINSEIDHGKCFVTLDARGLLSYAGHYLIYGSELLAGFTREGYQHVLTERGTPTLIALDIPLAWADDGDRESLAGDMLREWTRQTADPDDEVIELDFTLVFDRPIPPECVVGHSHPAIIPDPLRSMLPYRVKKRSCLHCETL